MRRDLKVLILVLTLPLILYSIGYAYATVTTSTYAVYMNFVGIPAGYTQWCRVEADSGDFVTGGGFDTYSNPAVLILASKPDPAGQVYPLPTPVAWEVQVKNTGATSADVLVYAVCMEPVTVAGIGIPEFASLYIAIALAASVYFALTRIRKPSLK